MKEELLKNIDRSASEVREAKQVLQAAEHALSTNEKHADRAFREYQAILDAKAPLINAVAKAEENVFEAGKRYSFYLNEAVNHPY